ncbi:hypothetical protein JW968_04195 [Candidatus Woesearchaeota archaeon]|nr:hypothetical protein [Candidatus Woesearchaeota archaeon]
MLTEEHKELVRIMFESVREELHSQNQVLLEAIRQVLRKQAETEEEFELMLTNIESKMESVLTKENRILKDADIELKKEIELLRLEREKS